MYSLNFAFKEKTKKITLPRNINAHDLSTLVAKSFKLTESIAGFTNSQGKLINTQQIQKNPSIYQKEVLFLITTQDMNEDNMSFASDHYEKPFQRGQVMKAQQLQRQQLAQKLEGFYQGVIGNLQIFEQLLLQQNEVTIVFCFVKQKPRNIQFPYYLYHTSKNSALIYVGNNRICQFFIQKMSEITQEITKFVSSLRLIKPQARENGFSKKKPKVQSSTNRRNKSKQQEDQQVKIQAIFDEQGILQMKEQLQANDQRQQIPGAQGKDYQCEDLAAREQEQSKEQGIRTSVLQNLLKLKDDQQITELEFYRMKSQLLENISDFMRKYQMGTRKGRRRQINCTENVPQNKRSSQNLKSSQPKTAERQNQRQQHRQRQRSPQSKGLHGSNYSREQRRTKKYEIPIIVRKYNNVIQKISTSYPLSQEQEQAINLILQLQLKGFFSQKESGIYKSSILQEDPEVFPLFLDYFDGLSEQVQLVSRLKNIKKANSEMKQRSEQNMRLLIKYAKQSSYQTLRNLMLQKNLHVMSALDRFRQEKNVQKLTNRFQKIMQFYRQKTQLEQDVLE